MFSSDIQITTVDLPLPHLPAALEGLRIAHLSDLHINRRRGRHAKIIEHLGRVSVDLLFLTGDYMTKRGVEPVAMEVMTELSRHFEARLGVYGVFGNHDSHEFRRRARVLPVHWLRDEAVRIEGLPVIVMGVDADKQRIGDSVAVLDSIAKINGKASGASGGSPSHDGVRPGPYLHSSPSHDGVRPGPYLHSHTDLRLMLSHYPGYLPIASDMGVDLMFSGHTHGGQWRLPLGQALYNSSDLPMHLTSGILRQGNTLCLVSRGLGETFFKFRIFCPPHILIYTLKRGELLGAGAGIQEHAHKIVNVRPW